MWTEHASIFFIFSQTKQFASQKSLKVQPTVLEKPADSFKLARFTLPDSFKIIRHSCQTVLIFSAFYSPPLVNAQSVYFGVVLRDGMINQFQFVFFPSIIFLRHKSRCHPETLESDPETLETDPETLESVKRQAERPQGYIVQVK